MTVPDQSQAGVTLVELILSIVIISVALTGVLIVINTTVSRSADPVVNHQAIAVAESYLEEILLQAYSGDPSDTEVGESRATFDDVDDYDGLSDIGVHNQNGTAVASLSSYNVAVSVSTVTLTGGVPAKRIDVTVTGPGSTITLTGYRASI